MKASASTQRKPPATPANNCKTNQIQRTSVTRNPTAASTGTTDASHMAGRRPICWVSADANGVMTNTPSQVVAANKPATVVETCADFNINKSHGDSMKMPES